MKVYIEGYKMCTVNAKFSAFYILLMQFVCLILKLNTFRGHMEYIILGHILCISTICKSIFKIQQMICDIDINFCFTNIKYWVLHLTKLGWQHWPYFYTVCKVVAKIRMKDFNIIKLKLCNCFLQSIYKRYEYHLYTL